jgi:hypothetical protein
MNVRTSRRLVIAVGASMLAIGTLAACNSAQQSPSTTTTTTTITTTTTPTSASPAPTEKDINPTAGNLFTPGVTAPGAPNVPAGQHPGINGVP